MAADGSPAARIAGKRRPPLVLQSERAECGLACLAMVARYYGHDVDLPGLRRRFSTSLKGMTLARTIEIAHALQLDARPIRVELEYLSRASLPCILHWDLNHFVVLSRNLKDGLEILDPARGSYRISLEEASKRFTGVILELRPSSNFSPIVERRRISIRALTGNVTGLERVVLQVFGLAIAIELLALVLPFQMQWVVDQVLLSNDVSLLSIIAIGFIFIVALQTALTVARAWVLTWFSATLDSQWSSNLFGHLIRLPMSYFQKRHMGDIISRFSSLRTIQTTLTGSFVETILDGITGALALAILLAYSVKLSAFVMLMLLAYGISRWAMFRRLRQLVEEKLAQGAKQQTELMESVRGIQAVKLANKQGERRARLENATIETAFREMQSQRITMAFSAVNKGIFNTQRVLLICFAAAMVMGGSLSAGMLIAFVAYADQLSQKISSLIDKAVEFKMLGLHAERIADIALEPPEQSQASTYSGPEPEAAIGLHGVAFRYSDEEPYIFEGLTLLVSQGECVGIYGPSGCGKTTLLRLVLGLLEPASGRITIGGIPVDAFGVARYREMLGAVTQDDQLFAGSIAQNISFFEEDASMENIMRAAAVASVDQDIRRMPMGYETLVGDMGSTLSGGQKQRVLLARALYRSPKILVLDEATSHLDHENAASIDKAIREMKITRIVVSHNPDTIARTDRQISMLDFTTHT